MLRYKFLKKLLILEYVIMIIILMCALCYKNVRTINILEEINERQRQTIIMLSEIINKKQNEKKVEAAEIEEAIEEETEEIHIAKQHRVLMRCTAYCACEKCCGKWAVTNGGGITASGTRVQEGRTIAVYKKQIPFGTEVYIEGMGTYIAEDTGSAIKENCIDIYFDSHEEAWNFGVKYLYVEW